MGPELARFVTSPVGQGALAGATAAAEGDNPVCGDKLRFEARLAAGRIEALGFRATACPATIAVASCAVRILEGGLPPRARPVTRLRAEVARLGGLTRFEQHALALVEDVVVRCVAAGR